MYIPFELTVSNAVCSGSLRRLTLMKAEVDTVFIEVLHRTEM
jgi:hypothetical protein